ncbi:MAG: DUF5615 family PIN-like protein [Bacteroidota bacterium]|nr:DUF5615 family PIN-like protein [Bacteroidota bacterium]
MFLANENFPRPSIIILRINNINIKSIQEDSPGISDEEVIKISLKFGLIILTFDKDYGELIFRYSRNNPPPVVFFRDKGSDPLFAGELLLKILTSSQISLLNAFTVIEEKNIRQRFYQK